MRNDHRHPEPPQKQSLKSVIKLYHRSENLEQKAKSNPSIFINQGSFSNCTVNANVNIYKNFNVNMNQHAFFQIQEDFIKLDLAMRSQILVFKQSCDKIKVMIISYYDELIKILTSCKKSCLEQVQMVLQKAQAKFKSHFDLITKRLAEIQNGTKKPLQHFKNQFFNLSIFEAPVFSVEGGSNTKIRQEFQKIVNCFKPVFTSNRSSSTNQQKVWEDNKQRHKENILGFNKKNFLLQSPQSFKIYDKQNDESQKKNHHQETVKKGTMIEKPLHKKICEFTCDEQLEWNPNEMDSRKFQKKQIVGTQVILEQPSSCQDSILISEGAENF